jgi:hypothetical protein
VKPTDDEYKRFELARPLWEAWVDRDGGVSIGEVFNGRMGKLFGRHAIYLTPDDAERLLKVLTDARDERRNAEDRDV